MITALKAAYRTALSVAPDNFALGIHHLTGTGRWPNIHSPKNFNEKIQLRKLIDRDPRLPILGDKIAAKLEVAKLLSDEWVTPTIWHGTNLSAQLVPDIPTPFVIKSSNGSGQIIFVNEPLTDVTFENIRRKTEGWLAKPYGKYAREWLYEDIEPQILIEPSISIDGVPPIDFKFFAFGGRVEFIQVDTGRTNVHKRVFYDRNWKPQEFTLGFPLETAAVQRPKHFFEMIDAAETLSKSFDFVRVDLYDLPEHPRFGEMTFYPGSGREKFSPAKYDRFFGDLWP